MSMDQMLKSKHIIAESVKKKKESRICCLQETHFRANDTHRLKVREWKKPFQANGNDKKSRGYNIHIRQNIL